jgi:peptidoglycan/xylan/chitin deacetylase (PgdA/CDA1 family)
MKLIKNGIRIAATAACALALSTTATQAQTLTSNSTGTNNGFYYSFWKDNGSASFGLQAGGRYTSQWTNDTNNWVGGKGWNPGNSSRTISYSGNFGVDSSQNSYLALYGWTRSPLIEYYVIESYGSYNPASCSGGSDMGSFQSDGATYNVRRCQRVNQPSIDGTQTFYQYFSVRNPKKGFGQISGTVTFANHAAFWASKGMPLGAHNYQIIATEGYQSRGSSDITVSEGTSGGGNNNGGGTSSSTGNTGGNTGGGTCSGYVGITFDDGPGSNTTTLINLLKQNNLTPVTWFNPGNMVASNSAQFAQQLSVGVVQNHSYTHSHMLSWSYQQVLDELTRTNQVIQNGGAPKPTLFRPPYGETNATINQAAQAAGLRVITWDVDSKDWDGASSTAIAQANNQLQNGQVILMHDASYNNTSGAIAQIAANLRAKGLCPGRIDPATGRAVAPTTGGNTGGGTTSTPTTSTPTTSTPSGNGGGITVRMRGTAGSEHINLTVAGNTVASWTLTTNYQNYTYTGGAAGDIQVQYDNDASGRDVQVDYIQVNGETRQAEDMNHNTGLYANGSCGGGGNSELMHCNGAIGFGYTYDCFSGNCSGGTASSTPAPTPSSASRSSTPAPTPSSSSRSSTPAPTPSSSSSSAPSNNGGACQCNWWGTLYPSCNNQTSGWGWENNKSCIGTSTCSGQGQHGGGLVCN